MRLGDEPLSAITSWLFIVPAVVAIQQGHGFLALALAMLAVGTWLYHTTDGELGIVLDHAGMLTSLLAIAALPFGLWWAEMYFFAYGVLLTAFYSHFIVGWCIALAAVCGLAGGAAVPTLIALALFGAGYYVWHKPGDLPHATWHVLTSAALAVMAAGF